MSHNQKSPVDPLDAIIGKAQEKSEINTLL